MSGYFGHMQYPKGPNSKINKIFVPKTSAATKPSGYNHQKNKTNFCDQN
jgi:hypothetical protein